ncbi:MAG: hypothetical protein AABX70_01980 [Nanoarchaeota archaeon]
MPTQRQTAYKCPVSYLIKGHYIQKEGWEPSYVETPLGNISRANLTGVIIGQEERSLILDDGTGQIRLTSFEENTSFLNIRIGDHVLTIGRPRLYQDHIYLNVEIIKKIDPKWLLLRKAELEGIKPILTPSQAVPAPSLSLPTEPAPSVGEQILAQIKQLDTGEGADIDEVLKAINAENGEKVIRMLLQEGEVYEIKPGKLKLL